MYQIKPRIIVEIMGVDALCAPIGKEGKVMVDDSYVEFLLDIANEKFRNNEGKILDFSSYIKYPLR